MSATRAKRVGLSLLFSTLFLFIVQTQAPALSAAQRRLLARRGAEVVATRNLARELGAARKRGLRPGTYTETIRARLRGVRVVALRERPDGLVTAIVEFTHSDGRRTTASGVARPPAR